MTRVAAVVVALGIALAGCSGFAQQDGPQTVTPAAVPTDEADYPPGVSEDIVAPSTLASAHARSLATTNFTLVDRQRVVDANGTTLRESTHTRYVTANNTVYAGQFRQNGTELNTPATRIEYWTNGSVVAARYDDQTNRSRRVRWQARGDGPVSDLSERRTILSVGEAVTLAVAGRFDDGVVLAGTRFSDPDRLATPLFVTDPTNASVRLRVRHDGTVEAFRLQFDARRDDRRVRVTQAFRVTRVGSTSVDKPGWTANATRRPPQR